MGNRRMMSKTVTQTQRFLTLPIEAQALYFHMLQNTDDDGVCEAFMLLKMLDLTADSLDILESSKHVVKLNSESVYYVTDFLEQNYIDNRRYTNSKYVELLTLHGILTTGESKELNIKEADNNMTGREQVDLLSNINKYNKNKDKPKKENKTQSKTNQEKHKPFKIKFENARRV